MSPRLFRRKPKSVAPEHLDAQGLARLAADGQLARTVQTPPPAPRASADRVRDTLAVVPVRGLGEHDAASRTAPPRQTAAATLVLDDEQRVTVSGPGLIGRDPSHAATDAGFAHVIALDDPDKLLSRTHIEFGFGAEGTFWVLDRDSANGVQLRRPGYPATMLTPGQRTSVTPQDVVVFGGHSMRAEPATTVVSETPLG